MENPNFESPIREAAPPFNLNSVTHQRLAFPIDGSPIKMASCSVKPLFQDPSTPANGTCFLSELFTIFGSCNGLLCLCKRGLEVIQLWNPSMRIASKEVPLFGRCRYNSDSGFGYDHLNDKYKLFLTTKYGNKTVTRILTFGTNGKANTWKTYCDVLFPDGVGDNIGNPRLFVLNNCLTVSLFDSKKDIWVLWQMKEYGVQDSWTRLMVIPHIVQEDGVLLIKTRSRLALYNPNDGRWDFPMIRISVVMTIYTLIMKVCLILATDIDASS
ncbi:hypothetical protein Fmac_014044 [Flemingia macrophylla]|uniref:F-box associated beta-propeller type 3 domain-containing protein n=1 Tax=Flemingia macrophylla TaxID=520843 RepID=A0ABD1MAK6_9FABA